MKHLYIFYDKHNPQQTVIKYCKNIMLYIANKMNYANH